ncbi:MAG: hypothetical protein NTY20_02145 [Candidatus Aenigmarchaeota archaeon]|nr:hypothetical protein [Candidatus Aenigmarchaeota archaeon]
MSTKKQIKEVMQKEIDFHNQIACSGVSSVHEFYEAGVSEKKKG